MISAAVFTLFTSLLFNVLVTNAHKHSASPLFLLVSFDGFRWDYLHKHELPNIKELLTLSSSAPYVINNFVTSTFPNHWSLATGLYEESHDIVNSAMYDPALDATFSPSQAESHSLAWFGRSEPVWVTNQRADREDEPRKSITQWPGSDVVFITDDKKLQDKLVNLPYNHSRAFTDLIDEYMRAFTDPHAPANFGALYFNEPDNTAHIYGPESEQLKKKLSEVDETVKYLIDQLKSHHLFDKINVIITSDHGMVSSVKPDSQIFISSFVDESKAQVYGSYPVVNVFLKNVAYKEEVYQRLTKAPHVTVYRREDVPADLHIKESKRVGDIVVIADPGYLLMKHGDNYTMEGVHGYLNNQTDMYPFFLSFGPGFKKNLTLSEPFHIVDIYPLVCKLLEIQPRPNNGSLDRIKLILSEQHKDDDDNKTPTTSKFMLTVYVLLTLVVVGAVILVGVVVYGKKKRLARRMEYTDGYFVVSTSDTNDLMENDELSRSLF